MSRGNRFANAKCQARRAQCITIVSFVCLLTGCSPEMADQPKYEPLEVSDFFHDGQASRPVVVGAVARGQLRLNQPFDTGKVDGKPVEEFPVKLTEELFIRGQQRFEIFCSPCHDRLGNGQGMVVRRGFPRPPSLHSERLRNVLVGHLYDVITNGFGRMPDYAAQISRHDRWAIVAYIRALQFSQQVSRDRLSAEDLDQLGPPSEEPGQEK